MTTQSLPGKAEAENLGYKLVYYAGNYRSATYCNSLGMNLTIRYTTELEAEMEAELSYLTTPARFTVSTGWFSFPHSRFQAVFELQMMKIVEKLEK